MVACGKCPELLKLMLSERPPSSSDRGCRSRRPSQPVVTPQRRRSSAATATGGPLPDWEGGGDTFHEDCLVCETCGLRLAGSSWQAAHRFQNKIYCGLHYADVTGLSSGEEFLAKLREYKRQSLGCAEARRKSSTTLTFPVPVQACPGTPCEQYPHCIKSTPGYWIECAGPKKESDALLDPVDGADSCGLPSNVSGGLELVSRDEDTYERHFYGKEHWNYFTNDEALGPVIMSLRQENINNRDQFSPHTKLLVIASVITNVVATAVIRWQTLGDSLQQRGENGRWLKSGVSRSCRVAGGLLSIRETTPHHPSASASVAGEAANKCIAHLESLAVRSRRSVPLQAVLYPSSP
ncbi:hypothetical protein HPB49_008668 [Dermacentor silvarum]|uniref:Uncharacterized protein n=1 Tax=Dermacentor silvarum TaxID=543639 RepID=A0ACB8CK95_DERSI|nr:hypothetical protein HPB49_008668 [Dermacentor silvarum]